MEIRNVCLLGATGFVGRALAARLYEEGIDARVITRRRMHASRLLVLPTLDLRVADPHDEEALTRHFAGMDAVVNLVGILHEGGGATFQSAHVDLPRKVANACRAAGVPRLVHMSALGASETAPSEYLRSKARGEASVRQGAGESVGVTIFRPSVIFGAEDRFLNLFARLVAMFPVIPLAGAEARFQPVWVEDVARAMTHALRSPASGRVYELCGPRAYTLEELVAFVARVTGKRRAIVALPSWAGQLQATALEFLPGTLMTRDNLRSMSVPNTCSGPFPEAFGFKPAAMEAVVPGYMAGANVKGRYDAYRNRAGR